MRHPRSRPVGPVTIWKQIEWVQSDRRGEEISDTHQLIHDGTHVIRDGCTWSGGRVVGEYFKDGYLGRDKQSGLAVIACINEGDESSRLGNGEDT